MEKLVLIFLATAIIAVSFSALANSWDYGIYNYVDDKGNVVGTLHSPCFNRKAVIIGEAKKRKVLVEAGTCL